MIQLIGAGLPKFCKKSDELACLESWIGLQRTRRPGHRGNSESGWLKLHGSGGVVHEWLVVAPGSYAFWIVLGSYYEGLSFFLCIWFDHVQIVRANGFQDAIEFSWIFYGLLWYTTTSSILLCNHLYINQTSIVANQKLDLWVDVEVIKPNMVRLQLPKSTRLPRKLKRLSGMPDDALHDSMFTHILKAIESESVKVKQVWYLRCQSTYCNVM